MPREGRVELSTSCLRGGAASVRDVGVVWLDLDPGPDVEADLGARLQAGEADRVGRLRLPVARRRATVRLVRRREIVAHEIGVDPAAVVIGTRSGGRPYVQQPRRPDIRLSTSSSGDLGVVAVGRGVDVGVDVQAAADMPAADGCLSWIANAEEACVIQSLPPTAQSHAVLEMWTAKEAYLKATGEGLGADMRAVVVVTPRPGQGHPFVTRARGPHWRLHRLRPPVGGTAAALVVAVRPEDADPI